MCVAIVLIFIITIVTIVIIMSSCATWLQVMHALPQPL